MAYRIPADVQKDFDAHPRRALIVTTVVCESRAVKAHLTDPEILIGKKDAYYEYGRFSDPAGDWLIVHALTPQGNTDAALVVNMAYQEFGNFHAQFFVGVAGSLKEDIPIGSVVIGDYVYNGHSARVEDTETHSRPHGLRAARALLTAAQGIIYSEEWRDLIRAPVGFDLPNQEDYPCESPPFAVIKGIVSGEEVVAGGRSPRYVYLRKHFNDCGAVEMEGWGAMSAAHHESASAIVVRGISDMCAGKDHAKDKLHQPIAAAHAAAFAFGILSFRSKVPSPSKPLVDSEAKEWAATDTAGENESDPEERRIDFVFNFEGSKDEWSKEKIEAVFERLKQTIGDEKLTLVRIDVGSVRLVLSLREADRASMDMAKLREAVGSSGVTLLGAIPLETVSEAERAREALVAASADLLAWEKTLPGGRWIERPEQEQIEARLQLDTSSTVLLGEPGSGKSALLSRVASDLVDQGATVFALKADFLSVEVSSEVDLQHELQLPDEPSDLVLRLAALQPVYVFIDQLDALASQVDLRSGRLNVLLNLVRRIGGASNVHFLLSARTFEFNHDVRLRAVEAEAIKLSLPPWHEVKEQLSGVGIDSDAWPEKARDVVRIPQALKTFIVLASAGRTEPFTTYQAMLEKLWRDRVASADGGEELTTLAAGIASQMAEEETLWLAASRFDDRIKSLKRLEALGFIVRSENELSIAFSHQTVFDYVLARTFVRSAGLLSAYVLERQDSLFVRAKVWSALNYLREAEPKSYEREFIATWSENGLRRHLRLLLIDFLGQVGEPFEFEKTCMGEVLKSPKLHLFGLKVIAGSTGWFEHFSSTAIREAMLGADAEANLALRILSAAWKTNSEAVVLLIKERWLPYSARDSYSWIAIRNCPNWTEAVEQVAREVLGRTPISIMEVDHTAQSVAEQQPSVAVRLVRAKLDFLLEEARSGPEAPPYPVDGTEEEKTVWYFRFRQTKKFEELLDRTEWDGLSAIAEVAPGEFIEGLWPWYIAVFLEVVDRISEEGVDHVYPGQHVLEIKSTSSEIKSSSRPEPLMDAIQLAVEELAANKPEEFLGWAETNSQVYILAVQQLIAHGYQVAAAKLASAALDWLLLDQRRFQLGTRHGRLQSTVDLVQACAPRWSNVEVDRFEQAVLSYRPPVPAHLEEPAQRKLFADMVRATRKSLLQAVGVERLSTENRDLVATEQRALGDRFDRPVGGIESGWVGSPMEATAMERAKDRDILKIFRKIPDNTNWEHPTHWMRGGNIQLSRAFAEFAQVDPERAVRLMEQFEPRQQERAAGYALDAMASDAANDGCIIDALLDLHARGFMAKEFRESAARAIEKIASRKVDINEQVVDILEGWLKVEAVPIEEEEEGEEAEDLELKSPSSEDVLEERSILWGYGGSSVLPGGNFNVLSALASIFLNQGEAGRDHYFVVLDEHLSRESDPIVWKALLYRLVNSGGATPKIVSSFLRKLFDRFPEILTTREAVVFLAYAQRWDDHLVFGLISGWRDSDQVFQQHAYGELVGLVAITKEKKDWVRARDEIVDSGTVGTKVGLAHSAVNMWPDDDLRQSASEVLVVLLKDARKELVAAVMDVFRVMDELALDASTADLLRALADSSTDMSEAPSSFIVERLQALLPYEADLVAAIAEKLIAAWRDNLSDIGAEAALAAPQLTDLALTLHRLGGESRRAGIALFETMIEIDAYGARETLTEIDGRFDRFRSPIRQRLARRRRPRRRRGRSE